VLWQYSSNLPITLSFGNCLAVANVFIIDGIVENLAFFV